MYDVIIIGGGIVGLATAMRLKESNPGLKVALLEKEKGLSLHQTGNNSGVIHSGLYYKPGSLKATNCRRGQQQLLEFCDQEAIPYEMCGKLVVATLPEELPRLEALWERGIENGLVNNKKLVAGEIKDYEPYAAGIAGIHVPYTGIVDYKRVSEKYADIFTQRYGGEIFLNQKVTGIRQHASHSEVISPSQTFVTRMIVNTAGLYCDKVAQLTGKRIDVRIIPFRGEYYDVREERHGLLKNLIYPVPDPAFPFLGVHFTRRITGGVEAGPNAVFALKREGYNKTSFSMSETFESLTWPGFQKVAMQYTGVGIGEYYRSFYKPAFTKALQRLMPDLRMDDLIPGGSGVRAQACTRDGRLIDDFLIVEDKGVINILNAPSPAATASLAIGETIAETVMKHL